MKRLSFDEQAALTLVLEFVSVKDLLTAAMHTMAEDKSTKAQDNADLCYKAITSFLS